MATRTDSREWGQPPPPPFFGGGTRGNGGQFNMPRPPLPPRGSGKGQQHNFSNGLPLPPPPGSASRHHRGRGHKRKRGNQQQQQPADGLTQASLRELQAANRRKTWRHFGGAAPPPHARGQPHRRRPSPAFRPVPAAPLNDNAYLTALSGGRFIDAVARTPTKDASALGAAARLTPSNYAPGEFWASSYATTEDMAAADVADAEALGHAGASLGLLGYLCGGGGTGGGTGGGGAGAGGGAGSDDSSGGEGAGGDSESDHGLTGSEDGGGGFGFGGFGFCGAAGGGGGAAAAALRRRVGAQAAEIAALTDRCQALMERAHDAREAAREAEARLARALEVLAQHGLSLDGGGGIDAVVEERVSEGGGVVVATAPLRPADSARSLGVGAAAQPS